MNTPASGRRRAACRSNANSAAACVRGLVFLLCLCAPFTPALERPPVEPPAPPLVPTPLSPPATPAPADPTPIIAPSPNTPNAAAAPIPIDWSHFTYLRTISLNLDITTARVSADGRRVIAAANPPSASPAPPASLAVYDLATGAQVATARPTVSDSQIVGLNHDGTRAITVDTANTFHVWDVATGAVLSSAAIPGSADRKVELLDDAHLLIADPTGVDIARWTLYIVNLSDGALQAKFSNLGSYVVRTTGLYATVLETDGTWSLTRFGLPGGQPTAVLAAPIKPRCDPLPSNSAPSMPVPREASSLTVSADGHLAALLGMDGAVYRYDCSEAGTPTPFSPIACDHPDQVVLSPDGRRLLTRARYSTLQMFDARTGALLWKKEKTLFSESGTDYYIHLGFTRDGEVLLTNENLNGVEILHASDGQECTAFATVNEDRKRVLEGVQLLPTGGFALVGGPKSIELWGPDPDPPPVNRDCLKTNDLARAGLRHTLFDLVINGTAAEVTARARAHPEELTLTDPAGIRVLLYAIESGQRDKVEALLAAGADPKTIYTGSVYTGLDIALETFDRSMVDLFEARGGTRWKLNDSTYPYPLLLAPPQPGSRGRITGVLRQSFPPVLMSRVELAAYVLDRDRIHNPRAVRYVYDYLRFNDHDEAAAEFVYQRNALVSTFWLLALQAALIVLVVWRWRVLRRRARALSPPVAVATPANLAPAPATATAASSAPRPTRGGPPADGWSDYGRSAAAAAAAAQAAFSDEDRQYLDQLRARYRVVRLLPLFTFFGALVVAILPAVNSYWFGHDINDFIWLPAGALAIWALTFVRVRWFRVLLHLAAGVGGVLGFIGGFMAWYSSWWQGPHDPQLWAMFVIAGATALPMAIGMAWTVRLSWRLTTLQARAKAAQKAARQAHPRAEPEEDLGVTPGWDSSQPPPPLTPPPPSPPPPPSTS